MKLRLLRTTTTTTTITTATFLLPLFFPWMLHPSSLVLARPQDPPPPPPPLVLDNTTTLQYQRDLLPKPFDRVLQYTSPASPPYSLPAPSVYMAALSGLFYSAILHPETPDAPGVWYDVSAFNAFIWTDPVAGSGAQISDRIWALESLVETMPEGENVPAQEFVWRFRWRKEGLVTGRVSSEDQAAVREEGKEEEVGGSGASVAFFKDARTIGMQRVFMAAVMVMKAMAVHDKEKEVKSPAMWWLDGEEGETAILVGVQPSSIPFVKPLFWQDVGSIMLNVLKYLTRKGRWDECYGQAVDRAGGVFASIYVEFEDREDSLRKVIPASSEMTA